MGAQPQAGSPSDWRRPSLDEGGARMLLAESWGIDPWGELTPLPSDRDRNLRVDLDGRPAYVLHLANANTDRSVLEAQHGALEWIEDRDPRVPVPRIVPTLDGPYIVTWVDEGHRHLAYLLTWVPGVPLARVEGRTTQLAERWGALMARVDRALLGYEHAGLQRESEWDLARAPEVVTARIGDVRSAELRDLVGRLGERSAGAVGPVAAELRRSAIHCDGNDHNVLAAPDGSGREDAGPRLALVDFGDLVRSALVHDVAIAGAYALLGQPRPLETLGAVARGFHAVLPLAAAELELLFDLVVLRLCTSIVMAEAQSQREPDDPYLVVSQTPVRAALRRFADMEPAVARRTLGAAVTGRHPAGLARSPRLRTPRPTSSAPAEPETGREPPTPQAQPEDASLAARRGRRMLPALSLSYRRPLQVVEGRGQFLVAADGTRYLDCVNNIAHVGHSHPRVVGALTEQAGRLNTNTRYLHEALVRYADALVATLPSPLQVCTFVSTGSEANELALRMARAHTGRRDVVVIGSAYHGNTTSMIEISPYKYRGPGGRGRAPWVHEARLPDPLRALHHGPTASGQRYAADVSQALAAAVHRPREGSDRLYAPGAAAFFAESLPSCGGQIVPPQGYLAEAFRRARAAGAVCVADEVQVGFGRVGQAFWGFELQGAVPDIVTMGKPMGNGHPVGAVVTTREIADSFANGMEYFTSFGGNPVSCAVGMAVLDVLAEEGLQEHASRTGELLLTGLEEIARRHPAIGDVRGRGLFVGVELVQDRATLAPDGPLAREVVNHLRENENVLLSADGPGHNVLKIKPPLPFDASDAARLCEALDRTLAELRR